MNERIMSPPGEDRPDGVEAIAAFRGEEVLRTPYLIRIGVIECGKEGNRFVASNAAVLAKHAALIGGNVG